MEGTIDQIGYLATTTEEYTQSLGMIASMSDSEKSTSRKKARSKAIACFSSSSFRTGFLKYL